MSSIPIETIERNHSLFVAADFVAAPDEIAELRFAHHAVRKPKLFRPDFAKDHTTYSRLDDFLVWITVFGVLTCVGIRQQNAIMRAQRTVGIGKEDLLLRSKEFQTTPAVGPADFARFRRQVKTTQRNVLRGRHDRLATRWAEDVVRRHHQ